MENIRPLRDILETIKHGKEHVSKEELELVGDAFLSWYYSMAIYSKKLSRDAQGILWDMRETMMRNIWQFEDGKPKLTWIERNTQRAFQRREDYLDGVAVWDDADDNDDVEEPSDPAIIMPW